MEELNVQTNVRMIFVILLRKKNETLEFNEPLLLYLSNILSQKTFNLYASEYVYNTLFTLLKVVI